MLDDQLTEQTLADLASSNRHHFLSSLGLALTTAGRDCYESYVGSSEPSVHLKAINEMAIVIFKQLTQIGQSVPAPYPDDAFLSTLLHQTATAELMSALRWALVRAHQDIGLS